jgi:AcrR family transcriptional regulator
VPTASRRSTPRRRSAPRQGAGGDRREEILAVSLTLFNQHGVRSVTTNHIAERMKISPGNLYYYFGGREDIVLALFERIEVAAPVVLGPLEQPITADDWATRFVMGIDTVWDNRFLFSNLTELTGRDPRLRRRVHKVAVWIIDAVVELLEALVEANLMRSPARRDDLVQLANNWYVLYWNWPAFISITRGAKAVRSSDVAEGALHSHLLFEPYLTPEFAGRTRSIIEAEISRRAARGTSAGKSGWQT